jgi:hypothetical protein
MLLRWGRAAARMRCLLRGVGPPRATTVPTPLLATAALLLLVGSVLPAVVATTATTVPMSDAAIYFSDYNWVRSGGTAMTANPGAFLRVSFSGASLALLVNGTGLSGQSVKLRYSVDDRSMGFLLPNATADAIALPVPALSGDRTRHTLELSLYASNEQADRWLGGTHDSAYLVLTGLRLDIGAVLAPPPAVLPRRAIVFGDSISEGTNAQLYDYDRGSCGRSGTLAAAAAPRSWGFGFGEAMQAEVSNCAFAAQGYSTFNSLLYGNVPPLLTLGEPTSTAWDKLDSVHSRLPLLKAQPPDFVVSAQGFNDQVCAPGWPNSASFRCSNANMSRAITQWLRDVRAATSPATVIVVVVPFGGEMRTQNLTRFTIIAGFNTYQSAATDPHALLVDLYPRARLGLMGADTSANCTGRFCSGQPPGPTANSCDGTHPLAHRHAHLGAMVAAEVSARIQTGCTRRPLKLDEVLHIAVAAGDSNNPARAGAGPPPPPPAPCFTFDGDCEACVAASDNRPAWSGKCLQLNTTAQTHSCVPERWWLQLNQSFPGAHSCSSCADPSCANILKPAPSCSVATDCHLLGDCIGGKCICDKGWTGKHCGQLKLGPVDKGNRPGLAFTGNATWGASPVRGADEKWYVAHAQMRSHCGIFQAWMTNSFIGLSVSSGINVSGPYHYLKELVPAFSHNPQVRQLPDGTYAMFFIGGWPETPCECTEPDDHTKCPAQNSDAPNVTLQPAAAAAGCSVGNWSKSACPDEMPGLAKDCCGPNRVTNSNGPDARHYWSLNTGCGIATSTAPTMEGPWSPPEPLLIEDQYTSDNVYCTHTNPSPVFLKNGSIVMAFNAGCCDPGCSENVGTAISDHGIKGPWRLLSRNSVFETNVTTAFYTKGIGHACEGKLKCSQFAPHARW